MLFRLRMFARDAFLRGEGELDLVMAIKNRQPSENRYSIIENLVIRELPNNQAVLRADDQPQFALEAEDARELMKQMWYSGVRPEGLRDTQSVTDSLKSQNEYLKEVNKELLKLVHQLIEQSAGAEAARSRHLTYTTLAQAEEIAQNINRLRR